MEKSKVVVFTSSGLVRFQEVETLAHLQDIVGGYIEAVTLRSPSGAARAILVVNEEGRLRNLARNYLAERFVTENMRRMCGTLHGDVFVCSQIETREGSDFGDAPDWAVEWATKVNAEVVRG
jgi:hypothetical protein